MTQSDVATVVGALCQQRSGALATVAADGSPNVGMVAFAIAPDGTALLLHLSTLAAHTRQLLADPRVAVLLTAPDAPDVADVQTLARLSITGTAQVIAETDARYAECRAAYVRRFPAAEMRFGFADFVLVQVVVDQARFVGGFAQARTLAQAALIELFQQAAT
jgi:putative heme iron utilization protein